MGFSFRKDKKNEKLIEKAVEISSSQQIDDEALEWVLVLTSGESNKKKIVACQKWRKQSSRHEYAFQQARKLWLTLGQSESLSPDLFIELQPSVHYPLKSNSPFAIPHFLLWHYIFPNPKFVLPSIFLILVLFVSSIYFLQPQYDYETDYGQIQNFQLSDGSRITLNTNSGIKVNFSSTHREVSLEKGEAFIQVSQSNIPFIVKTGDNVINAFSSAFSVAKNDQNTKVTVSDGHLDILLPSSNRISVYTGQQAIFNRYQIKLNEVNINQQLSWRKGVLIFSNDSLYKIINTVREYDDRKWVVYINNKNQNKLYSTTINIHNIDQWINGLSQMTSLKVKDFGSFLVIYN
ncbi:FecR domain-containing protein [Acinetobacter guillouiae]|uniref:FecR domain-containing protein n=1 Tax=Acinetobacter guillouiae TaxID=106649 RepID=A0A8X8GHG3_ACIGI|nr:FecR domain-containing protein [Acinetobacter guillouiae]MCF0263857.1 FecR domain-containing protein [Acinetobacter guillouiae]